MDGTITGPKARDMWLRTMSGPLTAEDLAGIREAERAASPAPWIRAISPETWTQKEIADNHVAMVMEGGPVEHFVIHPDDAGDEHPRVTATCGNGPTSEANARFVEVSRVAVPMLLRELDSLRARLAAAEAAREAAEKARDTVARERDSTTRLLVSEQRRAESAESTVEAMRAEIEALLGDFPNAGELTTRLRALAASPRTTPPEAAPDRIRAECSHHGTLWMRGCSGCEAAGRAIVVHASKVAAPATPPEDAPGPTTKETDR